jgi:hypothetical protein
MLWIFRNAIVVSAFLVSAPACAALIPPAFVDSVVALGSTMAGPALSGQASRLEWRTEGTGFFYGHLFQGDPEPTNRKYQVFLVTARHVIDEHMKAQLGNVSIRLNPKDSTLQVQEFTIPSHPESGEGTWFYHPDPNIDIAIVPVNFEFLKERGFEPNFFASDLMIANRDKMKEIEIAAGDGVFVLGFPMNLAGAQRNYVVARQGCLARISEMLDGASKTFMLDTFVFPGNSGGPVILKPEITSISGTKSQPKAYLIGIVVSYRPYDDIAISAQTKRARVIFEENSGLAEVLPSDYIEQTIEAWRATGGQITPSGR